MHDAGAFRAGAARQCRAVVQQRVDERAVRVADGGMRDQPGRFVHDDDVGVLEDDFERDVLRDRAQGRARRLAEGDAIVQADGPRRPWRRRARSAGHRRSG